MYLVFGVLAVAVLFSTGCEKKQVVVPPPPDVEVVEVAQKDVPVTKEWVATLDGYVNAQIRAQVSGYLLKQIYTNGAFVRKGAPLFQIDPRPSQAALEQAKANVEQAKGNLEQAKGNLQVAQARLGKTELDVARYTPLARESAISQQELDDAIQADLAAKAQVDRRENSGEAEIQLSGIDCRVGCNDCGFGGFDSRLVRLDLGFGGEVGLDGII